MSKKQVLIVLAALMFAAALVLAFWPGEREPEYRGRKLSEWLPGYPGPMLKPVFKVEHAQEAVDAMGTNALPCLVKWLDYERPRWQYKLMEEARKANPTLWRKVYGAGVDRKVDRMNSAIWAFDILGQKASPAIPDLVRLMKDGRKDSARVAAYVLGGVGEEAVPAVIDVLTNRQAYPHVVPTIRRPLTNGAVLVPVLVSSLTNQDADLRGSAATMLGVLGTQPHVVVPELIRLLTDQNINIRHRAVLALERYGNNGSPAVASILPLLSAPESWMRQSATNALRQIAPEVLTNQVSEIHQ